MAFWSLVPVALQDMMSLPGALTSGLTVPSLLGPLELNEAMASLLSVAPTVRADGVSAGQPMVFEPGPLLPAAQTTTLPAFTALLTASSMDCECSSEPSDIEITLASLLAA